MEMFIEYRLSMVFLLAFLLLLSPLRYKVPATIGIAVGCFVATAVFDGVYLLRETDRSVELKRSFWARVDYENQSDFAPCAGKPQYL